MIRAEVEKRIGSENMKEFDKFMYGQTCGIIKGELDYYKWDVDRFISYGYDPNNEPIEDFD